MSATAGFGVAAFFLLAAANHLPVPEHFEGSTSTQVEAEVVPEPSDFESETVFLDQGYYRVDAVRSVNDSLNRFGELELHYIDDSLSPGVDWHLVDTYGLWVDEPLGYDVRFEDVDDDFQPECVVTLHRIESAGNDEVVLGVGLDGFTTIEGLDEDHLSHRLELDDGVYVVEALRRRFGWFAFFEEVRLYRLDAESKRVLVGVYPGGGETGFYGESLQMEDYTGDGRPEVVIPTNTGGNDALICFGLCVLKLTAAGFEELFVEPMLAPLAVDADSDGDVEIYTFSAYASSFMLARVYRASFVSTVYEYNGEDFVVVDPLEYRSFFTELVAEREEYFRLSLKGSEYPEEILRNAQSLLAQMAVAHLDDEYADWWEGHRDVLRKVTESIEGGDWSEVERDFGTPEGFRTQF
ncbi:hypothetical protein KAU45_05145 [bacterium]|nr:hypothetical protein [bacterium]